MSLESFVVFPSLHHSITQWVKRDVVRDLVLRSTLELIQAKGRERKRNGSVQGREKEGAKESHHWWIDPERKGVPALHRDGGAAEGTGVGLRERRVDGWMQGQSC